MQDKERKNKTTWISLSVIRVRTKTSFNNSKEFKKDRRRKEERNGSLWIFFGRRGLNSSRAWISQS